MTVFVDVGSECLSDERGWLLEKLQYLSVLHGQHFLLTAFCMERHVFHDAYIDIGTYYPRCLQPRLRTWQLMASCCFLDQMLGNLRQPLAVA